MLVTASIYSTASCNVKRKFHVSFEKSKNSVNFTFPSLHLRSSWSLHFSPGPKTSNILLPHFRKFSEKNLAQMKTVYPKGLIFRQERNLRDLHGMPTGQQLTIDANFEEVSKPKSARKEINQNVLITRRNIFESSLVEITKKFHQVFCCFFFSFL